MRLIQDGDTYAVIQDDGMRMVDLKLDGKYITFFARKDLADITFAGWRTLTPREIRAYQDWETIRQSKKLKVLKRG